MAIGGGKYWRYAFWIAKKKLQAIVRTHLSRALALALAVLVLLRERSGLAGAARGALSPGPLGWVILLLTLGTIGAAIWELFGNKLTTSPQEVRFLQGIRSLLLELEKFGYGEDRVPEPRKRLVGFIEGFLEVACKTLCGTRHVDGGLMLKVPTEEKLTLFRSSKGAPYPKTLLVPLPGDQAGGSGTGPAGWCFDKVQIVYVPSKRRAESWPFKLTATGEGERYEPSEPLSGWVAAERAEEESFESVLCVPVATYQEAGRKRRIGVLNFSTRASDPFVDRDFMMAECFASILGHAFELARKETRA